MLDLDNGVVLVTQLETVRVTSGRAGAPLRERWGYIYVVHDGAIVRVIASRDLEQVRTTAMRLASKPS